MTDEQVGTVRSTNFFNDVKTLVNELLTDLQGLAVSCLNAELRATVQDVPIVITFTGGSNPEFPAYVRVIAPEDGSAGGVNAILPIEWMA